MRIMDNGYSFVSTIHWKQVQITIVLHVYCRNIAFILHKIVKETCFMTLVINSD